MLSSRVVLSESEAQRGLEAVLDKAVHVEDGRKITRGIDLDSMIIGHRDALLLFRTLCKMGMKEENDEVTIKTRLLSLELLQRGLALESDVEFGVKLINPSFYKLGIRAMFNPRFERYVQAIVRIAKIVAGVVTEDLMRFDGEGLKMNHYKGTTEMEGYRAVNVGLLEGVNHSFTKNFIFIDSVKAYLSYALLRASVSQSPIVFQYATGIFTVLLLRFRESLKGEIGVFFPLIVLRSLDSSDSSITQRTSVLR
ncbi:hypothetical protein GIB67_026437 [Kingdonia uniflora]|uniref:Mon2/Sec7/BIG1-like HUS domain-containing protein n=1 Tax=Kingdonia uniflora TaxID=39325 RepID=A0A7J7P673_9MAGN|nr:hypothetical protein GIB67_026437 [Kingdonia uniflora]